VLVKSVRTLSRYWTRYLKKTIKRAWICVLVIDLTNTDRYYDRQELYDVDIDYIKTKMPGHGQIPKRGQMSNLAEKINRFITEHPEKQVAIHCTHGFNRTGFLVCAYLKLFRGYSVPMAVAAFAKVRQGGIYRTEIIQALYDFYHGEKITVADVPKPDWHTKEKNKPAYKKESLKKPRTISNKQHSRSPPESSQEAAFSSASRNPLGNS
jgi:protein-tyrosine phosphatase